MEKTKIIIGVLAICLIVLGGYIVYSDFVITKIDSYKLDGFNLGAESVILKINQEQTIPVLSQNGNSTSIQWVGLAQLCNG